MDRGSKKRSRESSSSSSSDHSKSGKKKIETIETAPTPTADPIPSQHRRPLSIFEFPWEKESRLATIDGDNGCDLRDVFFSSLVDGCSAAIGFPGDRLSPSPAPISLPEETDGADCIWSCVLREPLPLRCVQ